MDLFQRCQLNKNVKATTNPFTSGYKRHFYFFQSLLNRQENNAYLYLSWHFLQFAVQILIYIRNNHLSNYHESFQLKVRLICVYSVLISSDSTNNPIDFMRMVPLEEPELHHSKQRKGKKILSLKSQQRGKMKTSTEPYNCENNMTLFALS